MFFAKARIFVTVLSYASRMQRTSPGPSSLDLALTPADHQGAPVQPFSADVCGQIARGGCIWVRREPDDAQPHERHTFQCGRCGRWACWCEGSDNNTLCDTCWAHLDGEGWTGGDMAAAYPVTRGGRL